MVKQSSCTIFEYSNIAIKVNSPTLLIQELLDYLAKQETITINLPDGSLVPSHYHVTEVGSVEKKFIDCGGTLREERVVSLQLWSAEDYDHRLHPGKLSKIISMSQSKLGFGNLPVEVEYQGKTIGKYGLEVGSKGLELTTKTTACLALEACGLPEEVSKVAVSLGDMMSKSASCTPGGGCC